VVAPRYPESAYSLWAGADEESRSSGVDLTSVPSVAMPRYPEVRLAWPSRRLMREVVERFRPDLVHSATEFGIGRVGQIAGQQAGLPLVSSYHTDFGRYAVAYGLPWLRGAVTAHLARFHKRSRRVYTPSNVSRAEVLALGVADVETWGRGVDVEMFHPGRRSQDMRAALGMGSRFTFLYVGRLAAEKCVEQVIEAFRLAGDMLPRGTIHLVIAGTGPREAEIRAAAPPGVTFLGFLDRRGRLPDLYANCDAFVFASVTETLGLVVLEAMASGLPVIAAPAGGVRDHLRDGGNGLEYPDGDVGAMATAMVRLAGDWALHHRLVRGARKTAEGLSWESEMDRLDRSYREVRQGGSSAPWPRHEDMERWETGRVAGKEVGGN
jgi:glycosyltransferase involved in cell wall biosynthesis